ncbi:MAG: VWA domain-containing protein, partial [Bacteroidota bacterium]
CQNLISRPKDTIMVLITDLYEGGSKEKLLQRASSMRQSGVKLVCLLALSDQGKPSFDHQIAQSFRAMDIPTFGCSPDVFPEVMAAAIQGQSLERFRGE